MIRIQAYVDSIRNKLKQMEELDPFSKILLPKLLDIIDNMLKIHKTQKQVIQKMSEAYADLIIETHIDTKPPEDDDFYLHDETDVSLNTLQDAEYSEFDTDERS